MAEIQAALRTTWADATAVQAALRTTWADGTNLQTVGGVPYVPPVVPGGQPVAPGGLAPGVDITERAVHEVTHSMLVYDLRAYAPDPDPSFIAQGNVLNAPLILDALDTVAPIIAPTIAGPGTAVFGPSGVTLARAGFGGVTITYANSGKLNAALNNSRFAVSVKIALSGAGGGVGSDAWNLFQFGAGSFTAGFQSWSPTGPLRIYPALFDAGLITGAGANGAPFVTALSSHDLEIEWTGANTCRWKIDGVVVYERAFTRTAGPVIISNGVPSLQATFSRLRVHRGAEPVAPTIDPLPLPVRSGSLTLQQGSALWELRAEGDATLYETFRSSEQPPLVAVRINGQEWHCVVEGIEQPQAFASSSVSFSGRSLAALADAPYQPVETYITDAPTTAAQLATLAQTFTGLELQWQAPDWLIPAGAWSYQGTPLGVVGQVAAAIEAVVEAQRDGPALLVQQRYPVQPNLWATTAPDWQIHHSAVERSNSTRADTPEYNAVLVAGQQQGGVLTARYAGTSGAVQAPLVTDPLLTDDPALLERAGVILASAGKKADVSRTLQVGAAGVVPRGALVRFVDPDETWSGLVRSVAVQFGFGQARQTIGVERRTAFQSGVFVPPVVVPTDPLWEQVDLLLEFEGAAIADVSSYGRSFTVANGTASINTADAKIGAGSLGGTGLTRVVWQIGARPGNLSWCVELWAKRPTTISRFGIGGLGGAALVHLALRTPDNLGEYQFGVLGGTLLEPQSIFTSESMPPNEWVHLCASFEQTNFGEDPSLRRGTLRLFINGVKRREVTDLLADNLFPSSSYDIGRSDSAGFGGIGQIDSYRLTRGAGAHRYRNSFSPNLDPHPQQ